MKFLESYIRTVDAFNRRVGRFAMYLIFALMGVLFWSSLTKYAGSPALWTLEFAQFIMVGYYLLGGAYSMQMGDHVRMDLVYGGWSPRRKAAIDSVLEQRWGVADPGELARLLRDASLPPGDIAELSQRWGLPNNPNLQ